MGEDRQSHRLPGEALRPPRWRIAVDFVLVVGLLALLGLTVPLLTGWPAPVRRWEETITASWAWRVVNDFVIAWIGYRATVTGAPGRWWRARRGHRKDQAAGDAA